MFRNTGANVFAKNQMRLAYEDKRDLYCRSENVIETETAIALSRDIEIFQDLQICSYIYMPIYNT